MCIYKGNKKILKLNQRKAQHNVHIHSANTALEKFQTAGVLKLESAVGIVPSLILNGNITFNRQSLSTSIIKVVSTESKITFKFSEFCLCLYNEKSNIRSVANERTFKILFNSESLFRDLDRESI